MPALVIWGERDPWLARARRGLRDALPNATLERVADAGHWPWLDQPAVIDRVARFLAIHVSRRAATGGGSRRPRLAARARDRLRDRLAAELRSRGAPAARRSCSARRASGCGTTGGTRATTRSATASCSRRSRRCSRRSSSPGSPRPGPRRCSSCWPAGTSARTPGSARSGSARRRRRTCSPVASRSRSGCCRRWRRCWRCSDGVRGSPRCSPSRPRSPVRSPRCSRRSAGSRTRSAAYADDRRACEPVAGSRRRGWVAGAGAAARLAFPEGGSEPFTLATLWPIPLVAAGLLVALPRRELALRVGVLLYTLGCIVAYVVSTPVGSNAARLGALVAGPLAALALWPRHRRWLLLAALPLLYLQWQAPIRDVNRSANDPSVSAAYYQPLLAFLDRQDGPPFRVEIPFTKFHWETYDVAPHFPLARGWERQLDIKYNHLFYDGSLTPATLRELAARAGGPIRRGLRREAGLLRRQGDGADRSRAAVPASGAAHQTLARVRGPRPDPDRRGPGAVARARTQLADPRRPAGRHGARAGAVHALLGDRSRGPDASRRPAISPS